ncbi:hypothetical protein BT63DRAFT_429043 [Microthyrium microscopicum]|uniref:RPEL repeat protein n=1 Tax=Microthyrium microscopicum TaxID=703497 RepID=A0A6A6TYE7_9PEZI|nr:hypothetical protein BT63DRAFT_429043 [Microthyrium microscopicum]
MATTAPPPLSTSPIETPIDETPISPAHASSTLSKALPARPDPQDLRNRNILHATSAAPALQSAQAELERQRIADSVKKGLAKRSDRESLVERNILPETSAAPALMKSQRELQKNLRRDSLDRQLQGRPDCDVCEYGKGEANWGQRRRIHGRRMSE